MRNDLVVPDATKRNVLAAIAGFVTFVIAVLGAVTGTLSYVRQQEVRLRLSAGEYKPFERRNVLPIGVVNSSHRGASIVGGKVLFNGRRFATVTRVLPDARLLSDSRRSALDVGEAAEAVPFSVAPGTSLAGAVLWRGDGVELSGKVLRTMKDVAEAKQDVWFLSEFPAEVRAGGIGRKEARQEAVRLARAKKVARTPLKLTLQLEFEPGGTKTLDVATTLDESGPPQISDWTIELVLNKGRVRAMTVEKPDQVAVMATLRVWSAASAAPPRHITRPVVGQEPSLYDPSGPASRSGSPFPPPDFNDGRATARFPLHRLPAGRYEWALTTGDGLQGAGTLITPCLRMPTTEKDLSAKALAGGGIGMHAGTDSVDTCSPDEQRSVRKLLGYAR